MYDPEIKKLFRKLKNDLFYAEVTQDYGLKQRTKERMKKIKRVLRKRKWQKQV